MPAERDLVLLYDGLCGFCNGTVRFILARDRTGHMRFASLQGEFAKTVLSRHPELAGVDSLVLLERGVGGSERVLTRSAAALEIAAYLGGVWGWARVLRVVPRGIRDWTYDRFAGVRYRVFGTYDVPPAPKPAVRERFLP